MIFEVIETQIITLESNSSDTLIKNCHFSQLKHFTFTHWEKKKPFLASAYHDLKHNQAFSTTAQEEGRTVINYCFYLFFIHFSLQFALPPPPVCTCVEVKVRGQQKLIKNDKEMRFASHLYYFRTYRLLYTKSRFMLYSTDPSSDFLNS